MDIRIGQQFGNYRLLRLLGEGGFASVYLAEHLHLHTLAAIKVLSANFTSQDAEAFIHEARTLTALDHPHILRVRDFGVQGTLPYLIMDYAPGGTLRDRHPSGSIIAFPTLLAYVKQVTEALAYIHRRKLIHRDIKPENMLIDAHGHLLLADFGIATVAHRTASLKTIDHSGTVYYMAPEQIKGKPCEASDQYALAVVVYEWLCGQRPFQGNTSIEIAMRHMTDHPPSLRHRLPSLPPAVEQVVFQALAKDPKQRWLSITAFSCALEQAFTPTQHSTSQASATFTQSRAESYTTPTASTLSRFSPPQVLIVAAHGEGHFTSINEAISHAAAHTRILVRPGVYVESITLDKEIEIVGDGPREHIFLEQHSTACLSLQTAYALVQGVSIRNSGGSAVVVRQGTLALIDCEIEARRGIYTTGAIAIEGGQTAPLIQQCQVLGQDIPAIVVCDYAQATIEQCTIHSTSTCAVEIGTGGDPHLRSCQITANAYGIWVRDYGRGSIEDCDLTQGNALGPSFVEEGCALRYT